jgi:signal transduction histidine kinase
MNAFYFENVELIYLAYGLIFVIMGYTIAIQVRNFSSLNNIKLARKLWLLARFGLTHGIADILENAKQIEEAQKVKLLCEERERIRRDLHDGIIQSIYVAGLSLENTSFLIKENTEEAQLQIHGIMKQLDKIIEDLRNYIVNLSPESFAEIDLQQGIKKLLTEYQAINNFSANVEVQGAQCIKLNEEERGNFYHIINEILTNIIKHANASSIQVSVVLQEKSIYVTIKDNGNGFDISQIKPSASKGQGIKNMYTRARLLSGKLTVTSELGKGTEISLCIDRREKGDEQSLSFG